jgi:hypothetical protein
MRRFEIDDSNRLFHGYKRDAQDVISFAREGGRALPHRTMNEFALDFARLIGTIFPVVRAD